MPNIQHVFVLIGSGRETDGCQVVEGIKGTLLHTYSSILLVVRGGEAAVPCGPPLTAVLPSHLLSLPPSMHQRYRSVHWEGCGGRGIRKLGH